MIAGCPKCSARYRVDPERVGPEGAKLRCTKCSALFLVRVPNVSAPTSAVAAPVRPVTVTPAPVPAATPKTADEGGGLVLVADPDAARGKATVEAMRSWGIRGELVHDGVEAMLAIQRRLPRAVVLDAALPRMYGFQICEIIKRNASLNHITVVLVGAVHDQSRYRRDPAELYGADVYLEQPDLPDGLAPLLRRIGSLTDPVQVSTSTPTHTPASAPIEVPRPLAMRPVPAAVPVFAATPPPPPARPPAPVAEVSHVAVSPADSARDEERERARRLARIAVSEMLLYQPERFAQACREGTLERALDAEIQEARALLRQRISPEVRAETDFVIDELHRVARERGAKG